MCSLFSWSKAQKAVVVTPKRTQFTHIDIHCGGVCMENMRKTTWQETKHFQYLYDAHFVISILAVCLVSKLTPSTSHQFVIFSVVRKRREHLFNKLSCTGLSHKTSIYTHIPTCVCRNIYKCYICILFKFTWIPLVIQIVICWFVALAPQTEA